VRVGTICYATEQGIGYLPKDFYDHGVVTDVAVFRHGSRPTHIEWYPEGTAELVQRPFNGPVVEGWLSKLDVLLQFETPFDWQVLALAKKFGVRTCIVPMYECTPVYRPHEPDKWICPSLLDQRDYFPKSPYLPVPVEAKWTERRVCKRFLHNGGNLGLRGHKGTREILEAWRQCKRPVDLTVRAQDTAGLRTLLSDVFDQRILYQDERAWFRRPHGASLHVDMRPVAREDLFPADFDCFVMAEKYNGLSLPLQEAFASGMCIVTSARFPMTTWLPNEPLIPVASYSRQRVGGPFNWYEEAKVDPRDIADKLDELYGADVYAYSLLGRQYALENSWEKLGPLWREELNR